MGKNKRLSSTEMNGLKSMADACMLTVINDSQKIKTLFTSLGFSTEKVIVGKHHFRLTFYIMHTDLEHSFDFTNNGMMVKED